MNSLQAVARDDARQWLKNWDDNRPVHTVEMGGLGPGYEQCIQVLVAESLRSLLARAPDPDAWKDKEKWRAERDQINADIRATLDRMGPSGAQMGAVYSLATAFYARGPTRCLQEVKSERRIMAQKEFPR